MNRSRRQSSRFKALTFKGTQKAAISTQSCLDHDNSIFGLIPKTPKPEPKSTPIAKDISLNDALSESSLNVLEDSPFCRSQAGKRSIDEAITPASQLWPRNKRLLTKTPVLSSSPGINVLRNSFRKKLEETPLKDSFIPDISTDFINFEPDKTSIYTQKLISQVKSHPENTIVQYSQSTGAHYVQRQRGMVQKNEENLIDDDISLCYNSHIESSQFYRDLQKVCDDCEKSILQVNELSSSTHEAVKGISRIDWDEDLFGEEEVTIAKCASKTQSSHGVHQLKPISSANISEMGPFFGLPLMVKALIKEFKGIEELYDWQTECLRLKSILQRTNLIYALPTSGGKTLVAEILMLREIMCRNKNVLFILPYVSIVQEKVMALSPFAVNFNFLVEEYAGTKGTFPLRQRRTKRSIFIATIEKGLALLDSLIAEKRSHEIGLIVVDELHLLGEVGRGGTLEILLSKAMIVNSGIQIVGMSATIGNINEVAEFLHADIYTRDFRPVELKEFVKLGNEIVGINTMATTIDEAFVPARTVDYSYSSEAKTLDPDQIAGLVQEVIPEESCLIFCPTKQNCENVAVLLCKMLSLEFKSHRKDEKRELLAAIESDTGSLCPVLRQTIPYGIAYHHSGLTSDERRHIEDAFRLGVLCVICCTSTLAAGVNLPAKRVILRSPYVGRSFLTLSKYKQMSGRAGRSGQTDSGESILMCNQKDLEKVKELLFSPMDEATSSLALEETFGLQSFILSSIELGLANNRQELQEIVKKTFLYLQSSRLNVNVKERVDNTLVHLYKTNAVKLENEKNDSYLLKRNESVIVESTFSSIDPNISQKNGKPARCISRFAPLTVSITGKAAIKACITLEKANVLYADLQKAASHLVLDYLHLLYLSTPYDMASRIYPNASAYFEAFNKLTDDERETAKVIGLTEVKARQIFQRKTFDAETTRILNRFYLTLVLYDLWKGKSVHQTDEKFKVGRGTVQSLMQNAGTQASSIQRFCEEIDEFWHFRQLFEVLGKRISYCCSKELLPLMELPSVRIGRAKQMFNAGYKTMEAIAIARPDELVKSIEHINYKVAKQLISAAKAILLEKVENLKGEMQDVMEKLK